jgi:hypothetical protein
MSLGNPLWGGPRIHGELLKLGFELSESTVAKYMVRPRTPTSQRWRTFLTNHGAAKLVLKPDPVLTPVLAVGNQFKLLLEKRMEWMCYSETSNLNIPIRRS